MTAKISEKAQAMYNEMVRNDMSDQTKKELMGYCRTCHPTAQEKAKREAQAERRAERQGEMDAHNSIW